jgi:hypothetical protein
MIEMLAALAIAGAMIAVVSEFAGRTMRFWNRGEATIAVMEMVTRGVGRLSTDLALVLPMTPPQTDGTTVFFVGQANRLQFVAATGFGSGSNGVELIDIAAVPDQNDTLLVRRRGPVVIPAAQLGDPVTLLRGRLQVRFSFSGRDGRRVATWINKAELPTAVVLEFLDAAGQAVFAAPFVLPIATNFSVDCLIVGAEAAARPPWCDVATGTAQVQTPAPATNPGQTQTPAPAGPARP